MKTGQMGMDHLMNIIPFYFFYIFMREVKSAHIFLFLLATESLQGGNNRGWFLLMAFPRMERRKRYVLYTVPNEISVTL